MTKRQKIIKSLLRDLRKASKLVDGAAGESRQLGDCLDHPQFIRQAGHTLIQIGELQDDLLDLEPTLVPGFLKPSLKAVDLSDDLERLLSEIESFRDNSIRVFQLCMTDEVAAQFISAWECGTGYEFARLWWQQQPKPFIPVVRVYRLLKHERRFMRYQSAKALEKKFKISIWDSEQGDVSLEFAQQWFNDWLSQQAPEQVTSPAA